MNKTKIDLNKWEKTTREEGYKDNKEGLIYTNDKTKEFKFFKPKQKFPIVFEGANYDFIVYEHGKFLIKDNYYILKSYLDEDIKAGFDAFKKAMEIRGLKDE